jgi:hypothetical protein
MNLSLEIGLLIRVLSLGRIAYEKIALICITLILCIPLIAEALTGIHK